MNSGQGLFNPAGLHTGLICLNLIAVGCADINLLNILVIQRTGRKDREPRPGVWIDIGAGFSLGQLLPPHLEAGGVKCIVHPGESKIPITDTGSKR